MNVMIRDGINDAPAMNVAELGIALGCGTDITREFTDICLLDDNLGNVAWAIRLSKLSMNQIRQNLF